MRTCTHTNTHSLGTTVLDVEMIEGNGWGGVVQGLGWRGRGQEVAASAIVCTAANG